MSEFVETLQSLRQNVIYKLKKLFPLTPESNLVSILSAHKGDFEKTKNFIENLIDFNPAICDILEREKITSDEVAETNVDNISKSIRLAHVMFHQGDYKKSLNQFKVSKRMVKENEKIVNNSQIEKTLMVDIYLGELLHAKLEGDRMNTLALLETLESLCIETPSLKQNLGMIYNNLGLLYRGMVEDPGQLKKSEKYYLQSYNEFKIQQDDYGMSKVLHNLGTLYKIQNSYKKALKFLVKGYLKRVEIKDYQGQANSLMNIVAIYEETENYEKCLNFYPILEKMSDKLGNKKKTIIVLRSYVRFLMEYVQHFVDVNSNVEKEPNERKLIKDQESELWEMIMEKLRKLYLTMTQLEKEKKGSVKEKDDLAKYKKDILSQIQKLFEHTLIKRVDCIEIKDLGEELESHMELARMIDENYSNENFLQTFQLVEFFNSLSSIGKCVLSVDYPYFVRGSNCDAVVYLSQVQHECDYIYSFLLLPSQKDYPNLPNLAYSKRYKKDLFEGGSEGEKRMLKHLLMKQFVQLDKFDSTKFPPYNVLFITNGEFLNKINFGVMEFPYEKKTIKLNNFCNFFQSYSLGYLRKSLTREENRIKKEKHVVIVTEKDLKLQKDVIDSINKHTDKTYRFDVDDDVGFLIRFANLYSSNSRYYMFAEQVYIILLNNFHLFLGNNIILHNTLFKLSKIGEISLVKLIFINLESLLEKKKNKQKSEQLFSVQDLVWKYFLSFCENVVVFSFDPKISLGIKIISIFTKHFLFADRFDPVVAKKLTMDELEKEYQNSVMKSEVERIVFDFRVYSKNGKIFL